MQITNLADVPLSLAVWAVHDTYDYVNDPKYFSITTLLKPIKQIVLSRRVDLDTLSMDVENFLATAMGTSIHDSIEKAWVTNYADCMRKLGYPEAMIQRIRINPSKVEEGDIPVYLEQRCFRELNGYTIGGKYDCILDGILQDYKSTTTMKWTKGSSDKDYCLQGSGYRWLNPDKVTSDYIRINFVFTDWSKLSAMKDPNYPQHRAMYRDIPLLSLEEEEEWLKNKLKQIEQYMHSPEEEMPECTDEELWRTPTKYKYFLNPSASRSTKNFEDLAEAQKYMQVDKKGAGVIKIVPGVARRCNYCSAATVCKQHLRYISEEE